MPQAETAAFWNSDCGPAPYRWFNCIILVVSLEYILDNYLMPQAETAAFWRTTVDPPPTDIACYIH